MNKINVAINGFGRIGRLTFRSLLNKENVEVVAVNDLTEPAVLAHLLKHDSVHGRFPGEVTTEGSTLRVNGQSIRVLAEKNPEQLPWASLNIDTVLESTGRFADEAGAAKHLAAGAKRVVISAPAKGNVPTVVLGVNSGMLTGREALVSNGSCTTNCVAVMAKVLEDAFGIERGFMSTVHAYTQDQRLQDAPHSDLRRARAAALSIIPTTTGAAKTIGVVIPSLQGKLDGIAFRVPVPDGSLTDLTVTLAKPATRDLINQAFQRASQQALKGILEYSQDPLVSADIVGNPHSCIIDSSLTTVIGNVAKVVGWYDNEIGYSNRTAELLVRLSH